MGKFLHQKKINNQKHKFVWQIEEQVNQWKSLQINSQKNSLNFKSNITAGKAAEQIGISKSTLEKYYRLLEQAKKVIDIQKFKNLRISQLKKLIQQHQIKEIQRHINEEDKLERLHYEIQRTSDEFQFNEYSEDYKQYYFKENSECKEEILNQYQQEDIQNIYEYNQDSTNYYEDSFILLKY